jgi:heme-degrading monooxygenase HmoA
MLSMPPSSDGGNEQECRPVRALITTLRFDDPGPSTEARMAEIAGALARVDGLLSTSWLRNGGRITLVQTFDSHSAVDAWLESPVFAGLGRLPGCRDVYAAQYDVSTRLNALSVLGASAGTAAPIPDLVPA